MSAQSIYRSKNNAFLISRFALHECCGCFFERGNIIFMLNTKFQIDDYVVYGGSGACVIEDICVPDIKGLDKSKQYYMLRPLYTNGSTIFSPIDNDRVIMRRVITKEEAQELIARIPSAETIWDDSEKAREEKYLQALHTYSCYEWIRIIKTLYLRMEERVQQKKSVGEKDQRFLRMAEDLLYGELAVPLEIPKDQVKDYILEQVRLLES